MTLDFTIIVLDNISGSWVWKISNTEMAKVSMSDGSDSGGSLVTVKLMKDEKGGLMWEEGIASVSFYTGNFAEASAAILEQFKKIVAANPWLAGRLVKSKEDGVCLVHPASPSEEDINRLFQSTSFGDTGGFKLAPNASYVDTCRSMYKSKKRVVVGAGMQDVCTILTLSESSPGEFALIFSISHVIGDGRTKYDILNMLSPGTEVTALVSTRIMSFSESMRDMCGRRELAWIDKPSSLFMMMGAVMPAMMGCKKVTCTAFKLCPDRVAEIKQSATKDGDVSYVSTNDIITSTFFSSCKVRIGVMGLDCRGRVDGISNDLAGNYVTALTMDPATFSKPASVRKVLSSTPYQTTGMPLPSCCSWLMGEKMKTGMITNWSSFAGNLVQLESCKMKVHLPVLNPDMVMWDNMVPFAYEAGEIGLLCWSTSLDENGLREALPVKGCISQELFPDSSS